MAQLLHRGNDLFDIAIESQDEQAAITEIQQLTSEFQVTGLTRDQALINIGRLLQAVISKRKLRTQPPIDLGETNHMV
jgi:hypothetical protein